MKYIQFVDHEIELQTDYKQLFCLLKMGPYGKGLVSSSVLKHKLHWQNNNNTISKLKWLKWLQHSSSWHIYLAKMGFLIWNRIKGKRATCSPWNQVTPYLGCSALAQGLRFSATGFLTADRTSILIFRVDGKLYWIVFYIPHF